MRALFSSEFSMHSYKYIYFFMRVTRMIEDVYSPQQKINAMIKHAKRIIKQRVIIKYKL